MHDLGDSYGSMCCWEEQNINKMGYNVHSYLLWELMKNWNNSSRDTCILYCLNSWVVRARRRRTRWSEFESRRNLAIFSSYHWVAEETHVVLLNPVFDCEYIRNLRGSRNLHRCQLKNTAPTTNVRGSTPIITVLNNSYRASEPCSREPTGAIGHDKKLYIYIPSPSRQ